MPHSTTKIVYCTCNKDKTLPKVQILFVSKKIFFETTTIGMELCNIPQISERRL